MAKDNNNNNDQIKNDSRQANDDKVTASDAHATKKELFPMGIFSHVQRRKSRQIHVGNVLVGGDAPISIQSMTNTKTRDTEDTINQIRTLQNAGCGIIRVAVPYQEDANALSEIVDKVSIPVVADIHFQSKYVFQAIDAGCAGVRVNPGNILKFDNKISEITTAAKQNDVSLRIGVNAGSLDKNILAKYGGVTPEALVESATKEASLFEKEGFYDFKISVKHHDPVMTIATYELLAEKGDWPLHLGVTEAGFGLQGIVKGASAISVLLAEGIGDTIRVSLTDNPIEEVKTAKEILYSLGIRKRKIEIVSCPTCGRTEVNLEKIVNEVIKGFENKKFDKPFKIAVMGCVVNGLGEAGDADFGVCCSRNGGQIFINGKTVKHVKENEIVENLLSIAESR